MSTQLTHAYFNKGDTIYRWNSDSSFAYIIEEGSVGISSPRGLELGILTKGQLLGEISHYSGGKHSVSAEAMETTVLRVIDASIIQKKISEADPVCRAIINALSSRINDANSLAERLWEELEIYKSIRKEGL